MSASIATGVLIISQGEINVLTCRIYSEPFWSAAKAMIAAAKKGGLTMGETTKIQWADHTFNPWRGCTKVAPGCANCYAEKQSHRNPSTLGVWGDHGTRVVASESMWKQPLKWNAAAKKDGVRRRVFCASLADVFEGWRGAMDVGEKWPGLTVDGLRMADVRSRLFDVIDSTPWLDWLLLTKRPQNVFQMWPQPASKCPNHQDHSDGRDNIWIVYSASDARSYGCAVDQLVECRDLVPVLGVSLEPLIGPIRMGRQLKHLDWVVVGGESGPGARPCRVEWVRSIVEQCEAAGVPCFVKQLGAIPVGGKSMTPQEWRLREPKGGDMAEWPEDLRVREFPRQ